MADPKSLVSLGREGSGLAQIFDTTVNVRAAEKAAALADKRDAAKLKAAAEAAKLAAKKDEQKLKSLERIKLYGDDMLPKLVEDLIKKQNEYVEFSGTNMDEPGYMVKRKQMEGGILNLSKEYKFRSDKWKEANAEYEKNKDKYDPETAMRLSDYAKDPLKYGVDYELLVPKAPEFDYQKYLEGVIKLPMEEGGIGQYDAGGGFTVFSTTKERKREKIIEYVNNTMVTSNGDYDQVKLNYAKKLYSIEKGADAPSDKDAIDFFANKVADDAYQQDREWKPMTQKDFGGTGFTEKDLSSIRDYIAGDFLTFAGFDETATPEDRRQSQKRLFQALKDSGIIVPSHGQGEFVYVNTVIPFPASFLAENPDAQQVVKDPKLMKDFISLYELAPPEGGNVNTAIAGSLVHKIYNKLLAYNAKPDDKFYLYMAGKKLEKTPDGKNVPSKTDTFFLYKNDPVDAPQLEIDFMGSVGAKLYSDPKKSPVYIDAYMIDKNREMKIALPWQVKNKVQTQNPLIGQKQWYEK